MTSIITWLMSRWINIFSRFTITFSRLFKSLLLYWLLLLLLLFYKTRLLMNLIISIVFIWSIIKLRCFWSWLLLLLFLSLILVWRLFIYKTWSIDWLSIFIKILAKSYTEITSNLNLCYLFELQTLYNWWHIILILFKGISSS